MKTSRWLAFASLAFVAACFDFGALEGLSGGVAASERDAAETAAAEDAAALPPLETSFCKSVTTPYLFCDDFDDDVRFATSWNETFGSAPERETDGSVSTPSALHAAVPIKDATTFAFKRRSVNDAGFAALRYAWDFLVDAPDPRAVAVRVGRVSLGGMEASLVVTPDKLQMTVSSDAPSPNGSNRTHDLLPVMAFGRWIHAEVVIDASVEPATFAVAIDGAPPVVEALSRSTSPSWAVLAGIYFASPNEGPWSVRFDNVVVSQR